MTIDLFDTLHFARRLRDMGVSDTQAEAGAELARETLMRLSSNLATREDLNGVRTALELKLGHMESKFDIKFEQMESKVDSKFGHMETKFEANLNSLGALLRAEIRVTRVMIAFLSLIVLGTWGVLALPLLTSVRLA